MKSIFLDIWHYRNFIYTSIKTDFISKFTRSKLGGLWILINPLAQVAMYALVLSSILSAKLPGIDNKYSYSIYLISGMFFWSLFNEVFTRCINVFVSNSNIIKKISFPKLCLPLIETGSSLINNIVFFIAILIIFILINHNIGINLIYIPLLMFITVLLALFSGLFLGIINVFIRDVGQIMSIAIQFLFWLTPIVYMTTILPEKYRDLLFLNPLVSIVQNYHNVLVYNKPVNFELFIYPIVVSILLLALTIFTYNKAAEEMADVL